MGKEGVGRQEEDKKTRSLLKSGSQRLDWNNA